MGPFYLSCRSVRERERERDCLFGSNSQLSQWKKKRRRGVLHPCLPFSPPFPQILSLLLFLPHPGPSSLGFSTFNQSATIRADRATGNNRGRVSGGVTSWSWGVGIEGRPRPEKEKKKQQNATPVGVSRLLLCASGQ